MGDEQKKVLSEIETLKSELRQSEERYQHLVDGIGEGIGLVDPNEVFVFANPAACSIFGLPEAQLVGRNLFDFLDSHARQKTVEETSMRMRGQRSMYELEIIRNDGTRRWINVTATPHFNQENSFTGTFGIFHDITERKLAELKLAESEKKLRELVDLTSDWIWEIDPQWCYTYVSPKVSKILGYLPEELLGQTPFAYMFPEDVEKAIAQIRVKVHQFLPLTSILNRARHKDGHTVYLETSGVPIFDDNGIYLGYRGADRDVTLRKQYELELIQAKEKAEESDRLKSTILANMSHELRTPLNGILGFSEILRDELKDSELVGMVDNVYNSGKRLMTTLNSIITLSQLESGKIVLAEKEVALHATIASVIRSMDSLARDKNLVINTREVGEHTIVTDDNLLKNVIRQLLDNAIKFSDHGEIGVSCRIAEETEKRWMIISIADSGIGIDPAYHDFIFQEFRQVSEGFGRKYQGTGIGLSISKRIIELLRGKITLKSEPGKGSMFSIWLPLTRSEQVDFGQHTGKTPSKAIPSGLAGNELPLILQVEDNSINKELTEVFLRSICQVDYAPNAASALELVRSREYRVILMDINLGMGMNGIETTREIRKVKGYEHTPVIAVTGYTMPEETAELFAAGCTGYISKPYDKQTLINTINEALKFT